MATTDENTLLINALTTRFNSLITETKAITDFTQKANLDGTEEIVIAGNEKITVQQVLDYINASGVIVTSYDFKTANYTLLSTDSTIECTANSFTITLPTAVGADGKLYSIKNTGTGVITIDADGTETIDGNLTQTLINSESLTIQSNGSNWVII
jgi:hypothetical protein